MDFIGFLDDSGSHNGVWNIRLAARAVLFNQDKVALLHIKQYDMYKLPGGGVNAQENIEEALKREIKEETGCTVREIKELGVFIEKRDDWKLFQVSFCYWSNMQDQGEACLTQEETDEGFSLVWADNLEHALQLIHQNHSDLYDNRYITQRDTAILESALKKINIFKSKS